MFADNRFDYLEKVRYGLGFVTTPVYWLADTPARISFWIDNVFISRTDLVEENASLRQELLLSQRQLQLLESLVTENNRLRTLQNSAQAVNGEVLPAEIINTSPDPFSKRVLINKGALDKVYVGQALLDAYGLMGQVDEVLPFTSWVLLITDSHHVTPVQVNRNGERALARGSRSSVSELDLEFVTQTQDIVTNDLLVSSGMGQVYPKDYPVAKVTSVYVDPGQPYVRITAEPLARIDSTRNVMLVFHNEGDDQPEQDGLDSEQIMPSASPELDAEPFYPTTTENVDAETVNGEQALGESDSPVVVDELPLQLTPQSSNEPATIEQSTVSAATGDAPR